MSRDRTEARLDAVLATLRARPVQLDEITRARIGDRLETALACERRAAAMGEGGGERRWRWRGGLVVGGLAAAAVAAVMMVARNPTPGAPVGGGVAAGAVAEERAAESAEERPIGGGSAAAAVSVSAGETTQLVLDGASITLYGPGQLRPIEGGAEVEAAWIVIDRSGGDTPWSLRYHGVEVVATRATFALDRADEPRVTVMRGELVVSCSSGIRTLRAGASATCAEGDPRGALPQQQPPATRPPAPRGRAAKKTAATAPPREVRAPAPPVVEVAGVAEVAVAQATATAEPAGAGELPSDVRAMYAVAEAALRRGEIETAGDALAAVVTAAPDSLDAAAALLDLARLASRRGDPRGARGYLDQLARHRHGATLAAPAARLRERLTGARAH